MRRALLALGTAIGILLIAAPASAFAHDRVHNVFLHSLLDVVTLAVVSAPLWTAYLWGGRRRALLVALVSVVQIPVAIAAFVPIPNPWLHSAAMAGALTLTGLALYFTRPSRRAERTPATR
ncbi:hypothetical protein [Longispora albida]|uniref:hypothetical protein n=1 Tax=Longispora albida TaxID=203523 RepID=UPI00037B1B87|nr:hypothetical protein [Longispora albida]